MNTGSFDTSFLSQRSLFRTNASRRGVVRMIGAAGVAVATGGHLAHSSAHAARHSQGTGSGETRVLFDDDFSDDFEAERPDAAWFHFAVPGPDGQMLFVGDDGEATTSAEGLRVAPSDLHATTGEPIFTKTLPQENAGTSPVPGGVDHVKWLVYANRLATSGIPGFDAVPGEELVFTTRMSGKAFGTAGHPFGSAVVDVGDDLRLAAPAFNTIDFETFMVYDFWLTNTAIYAFYERLPFGREHSGNYAAFSFQIPVATRRPDDWHELSIAYDRAAGTVRWLVDGDVSFEVDRIGHHIDRQYLTIDHGGIEETVESRQLNGGMGLFTLLDGYLPSGQALVRLSSAENFYFNPLAGEPEPQTFVDEASAEQSRLFGQAAELRMERFAVESVPVSP